jgi:signal transduction histidine kinase
MLNLINDLLDVTKIESGKLELRMKKIDLTQLLQENYAVNQMLAKKKQIELKLDIAPDIPSVEVDPERFNQVIDNLISNALKFSHPKTTVTIRLRSLAPKQLDKVEIAVVDQGQGIPADEIAKVFDKFHRTSVQPTAGERTTGLGLAIVKKIVEALHGTIRIESQVGIGTTFYVTLPIAKS